MIDPRLTKLAKILVNYSVTVKKGDKVLISVDQQAWPLGKEVYQLCLLKGALPHVSFSTEDLDYFFFKNANLIQLTAKPQVPEFLAKWADKFIRLYSRVNNRSLANINPQRLMIHSKSIETVQKIILSKPWVVTEYPSPSMAQSSKMSLDELEKIYFKACLQDWQAVGKKMWKLKKILDNAQKVEIFGEKTNLTLSFSDRLFQACDGRYNMPDGEVFAAPVDHSAEGNIYFDLPSLRSGNLVKGVELTFKRGRVVKAKANQGNRYLQVALDTDAGAKRLGEFAIGTNFNIKKIMLNTLFDEKIGGTIHLALGNAYPDKEGGGINKSAIHWDLIKSMKSPDSQVLVNGRPILKQGKLLV